MRTKALLLAAALSACSNPAANTVVAADNTMATTTETVASETPAEPANDAASNIDEPYSPPAPGEPGGLPDDRTPIAEGPIVTGSAQDAANVIQTYYALIGEAKYRQAWALWRDHGKGSQMTADAFAASFGKYSEYHANVGAPGAVDAGAGQRYVEVPVQVYGRVKATRKPFNLRGTATLHRTEVDGATAEQRAWRIDRIAVTQIP